MQRSQSANLWRERGGRYHPWNSAGWLWLLSLVAAQSASTPRFEAARFIRSGTNAVALAAADLSGDAIPDLAILNQGCPNCLQPLPASVSVLLARGDGRFSAAAEYPVAIAPSSVAVADLNGDSWPDLVVADPAADAPWILRGKGHGEFQAAEPWAAQAGAVFVATADLNGDSVAEVVTANGAGDTISLFRRGAAGSWTRSVYSVGANPVFVAIADLNRDQAPDLVVANRNSGSLSILMANASGGFAQGADVATQPGPIFVSLGDFDGDGIVDAAVANQGTAARGFVDGKISILAGAGDGSLRWVADISGGGRPTAVFGADLDRDGRLELVAAHFGTTPAAHSDAHLAVFRLLPGAGIAGLQRYGSGGKTLAAAAADFDRDGVPDLVALNARTDGFLYWRGFGDGTFEGALNAADRISARATRTGDFNRDGFPDLASGAGGGVHALLGRGDGTFARAPSTPGPNFGSLITGDFNGDGALDLAGANSESGNVSVGLGRGDGTFGHALIHATGRQPHAIAAGDFDGNRRDDLAVSLGDGPGGLWILLSGLAWPFHSVLEHAAAADISSMLSADFNADNRADLAVVHEVISFYDDIPGSVQILLGLGDGSFRAQPPAPVGRRPNSICAGDFDRDQRLDLAVANESSGTISVLLGRGDGTFRDAAAYGTGRSPYSIATADFNGDGHLDLVLVNSGSANFSILAGRGDGSFQMPVHYSGGSFIHALGAADFDLDGQLDVVAGGTVFFNATRATPPRLVIARDQNEIALSWRFSARGFALETTPTLAAPNWTRSGDAAQLSDTLWRTKLRPAAENRYFRLRAR